MDFDLSGKNALVCGASSGIGFAIAEMLSSEGGNIMLCSRSQQKLETAAERIAKKTGRSPAVVQADLSSAEDIESLVERVKSTFGNLNILVNNVGGPPSMNFVSVTDETWLEQFQSIFMSVVRLVRGLSPIMPAGSSVVNILSKSAKEALPGLVISNAFRPAVAGLAKTLSIELASKGIRINNVCPGAIQTDRQTELLAIRAQRKNSTVQDEEKRVSESIPIGRIGDPEDIASMVTFLCSRQAGYITGASFLVDGGATRSNV